MRWHRSESVSNQFSSQFSNPYKQRMNDWQTECFTYAQLAGNSRVAMTWNIQRYSFEKIFQSPCKRILEVRKQFSRREIKSCDVTSKKQSDETHVPTATSKVAFWRPRLQSKNVVTCAMVQKLPQQLPDAVRDLTDVRCLSSLLISLTGAAMTNDQVHTFHGQERGVFIFWDFKTFA